MGALSKMKNKLMADIQAANPVIQQMQEAGRLAEEARQRQAQLQQALAARAGQMTKQAEDYRKNLGNTQSTLFGGAQESQRKQLAQDIAGVRSQSAKRGLLHSGLRMGGEAAAQSNYASELQRQRSDINRQTEAQARQMEEAADDARMKAIDPGYQSFSRAQDASDRLTGLQERNFEQQQRDRAQMFNAVGGAVGQIGGAYLGSRGRR